MPHHSDEPLGLSGVSTPRTLAALLGTATALYHLSCDLGSFPPSGLLPLLLGGTCDNPANTGFWKQTG